MSRRILRMLNPQRKLCAALFFILLSSFFISSCTSEVDNYFPQSASERLQAKIEQAKEALRSAEHGWELEYYPGADFTYGGVIYIVKFDGQQAAVTCSLVPGETEQSLYKVNNDQGPVLSFDTYSRLLHYYATPSSAEYEAKGGDFEFVIDSIGDDRIKLRGKKSHRTMFLRKLQDAADGYAERTVNIFDHFTDSIRGHIGSVTVDGQFSLTNKQLALTVTDGTATRSASIPFTFTDSGIRLYQPVTIGGQTVQTLDYDTTTRQFTCPEAAGTDIRLEGTAYPQDYMSFPMYEGDYSLVYDGSKTQAVTLVANRLEGNYQLRGLSSQYTLTLQYHAGTGALTLGSQQVGTLNGNPVYFVCYDADQTSGGLSLIDEQQFTITWNKNRFYPVFTFSATNPAVNNCNSSLLIYLYTNDEDQTAASLVDNSEWLTGGSPQLRNIRQLNRRTRIE